MNRTACCTTGGAFCYWVAVFLVVYGSGLTATVLWPDPRSFDQAILLASLGAACLVNFARNRTYHCALTGPLFLAAALVVGFDAAGVVSVELGLVWGVVLIGVGLAALLEARFAHGERQPDSGSIGG